MKIRCCDKLKEYESSKLLLDVVKAEYDSEYRRASAIETRITIMITFAIFMAGYLFTKFDSDFMRFSICDLKIFLMVNSIIFLSISILIFIYLLISRTYKVIELKGFSNIDVQGEDEGLIAYDILQAYLEAYEYNQKVINKKITINNIGIFLLGISFLNLLIIAIGGFFYV